MLTINEMTAQRAPIDSAAPVAMIDAILNTLDDIWERMGEEAEKEEPDHREIAYLAGIISGLLGTADAAEKMVQLDKYWSADPDAVNVLLDLEDKIDILGRPGMQWSGWKEGRDISPEFLEQLQALDTEEESGDNEND